MSSTVELATSVFRYSHSIQVVLNLPISRARVPARARAPGVPGNCSRVGKQPQARADTRTEHSYEGEVEPVTYTISDTVQHTELSSFIF